MTQLAVDTPTWWGGIPNPPQAGARGMMRASPSRSPIRLVSVRRRRPGPRISPASSAARIQNADDFLAFLDHIYLSVQVGQAHASRTRIEVIAIGGDYLLLTPHPGADGHAISRLSRVVRFRKSPGESRRSTTRYGYMMKTVGGLSEFHGRRQTPAGVSPYTPAPGPCRLRSLSEITRSGSNAPG